MGRELEQQTERPTPGAAFQGLGHGLGAQAGQTQTGPWTAVSGPRRNRVAAAGGSRFGRRRFAGAAGWRPVVSAALSTSHQGLGARTRTLESDRRVLEPWAGRRRAAATAAPRPPCLSVFPPSRPVALGPRRAPSPWTAAAVLAFHCLPTKSRNKCIPDTRTRVRRWAATHRHPELSPVLPEPSPLLTSHW